MSALDTLRGRMDAVATSDNPLATLVTPPYVLLLPLAVLLLVMFVGPMVAIVLFSVQPGNAISLNPGTWTVEHYAEILGGMASGEGVYGDVLVNTAAVSAVTTVVTLVLSYPAAYALARKIKRYKTVFLLVLIIPLFTSVNIRVFGWALFLVNNGVLESVVSLFGVSNYPTMMYQRWTIILGTTYVYMPFMLFPIYLSLLSIEDETIAAAQDLGANRWTLFRRIVLPLSKPGVIIGSLFVFILSLGADVEAQILGGGSIFTMASNINYSFGYSQNWPLGSAQAVGLLIITVVCGVIILRTINLKEIASRGDA
ncbi:spermidine/putrescine transport system permease protein [Haloplanus vescus]|uniref:Spermidine/putrescine transport system permease protein n=1 Tax=Haloplanus vescus TaxID=555874 RepID=A0A1H3Z8N4_9EURY|nr:ABC transporter permease [Haloplanus vescus]SEA20096.1 spermidine/putrescine transport system permease protein [Haloplanus vescus]